MANDASRKAQALAHTVYDKLVKGKECERDAKDFLNTGAQVPDCLVEVTFGQRQQNVSACPKTLRVLLEARANVHGKDSMSKGPLIHRACWEGSVDVVKMLLEFRADIEVKEEKMKTPPLNTALAAGNAQVSMELLRQRASVDWKHEDGATPLHVAAAWIASAHNHQMRKPPLGEEPRTLVALMLQNGVDPTVTEGLTRSETRGQGMTPLESFRREIAKSPWRQDPEVGPRFDAVASKVHKLLEMGETAVKRKNEGNQAFKTSKHADAIKLYSEARNIWKAAEIGGHHMAVLFSNEATCYRMTKEWKKCQQTCDEGLQHSCSEKIRRKLEELKKDAQKEAAAEDRGEVKEAPPTVPRKPPSKLEGGFLSEEAAPEKEFYPEGSVQGGTGKSPGPFICGFNDALHAGFVDGCDGDKDKKIKQEQELDKELVREGYLDPEFLATSDNLDLINRVPKSDLDDEKREINQLKAQRERAKARARKQLEEAIKSGQRSEIVNALENAKREMVGPEDDIRKRAQSVLESLQPDA